MTHMLPGQPRELGILVIASVFRDAMPWIYEPGLEAYRTARKGSASEAASAIDEFRPHRRNVSAWALVSRTVGAEQGVVHVD